MELKRIKPNAIDYSRFGCTFPLAHNWDHEILIYNKELLTTTDVPLETFNIVQNYQNFYNGCFSVDELLEIAGKQVNDYANQMIKDKNPLLDNKTIHKFAVVQVGYKFVVWEIK